MLYFKFKDYEEFKEDFGMRNNTRKNNILLSFLKHEMRNGRYVPKIHNLNDMYHYILKLVGSFEPSDINVMDFHFPSETYRTDENYGLCKDRDCRSIRYIRKEDGREFKMKSGKFLRKILLENELTKDFCEQAIIYVCETFANDWYAYASSKVVDEYILVVDDDFEVIYNSDNQAGGFNSCMNNKGYEEFYKECVDAKAASIWDDFGTMLARCVIFTHVHDCCSPKVYRLAERQYAQDENNALKQILVNKLIESGEIDGYKKVGASCHDPHMFVLNDGTSLTSTDLYINSCNVEHYEVPYMDSFKYYNEDESRFYNSDDYNHTHTAECTSGDMESVYTEYDEYHDCYCRETVEVRVWCDRLGYYLSRLCDIDRLEDFTFCDEYDSYYNEVEYSDYNKSYIPSHYAVYSNYHSSYIIKDEAKYSEDMHDWIPKDEYESVVSEFLAEQEELVAV